MEIRAVFVDGAGTLLHPREPVGFTYARMARARGHTRDPIRVQQRFRAAMAARSEPQDEDGRPFWSKVVADVLETDDPALFEDLYAWYAEPRAWWVNLEALTALTAVAQMGIRLGIISNWDTRLRALYNRLALDRMFLVLACSGELGVEKPDPWIFRYACRAAGVRPREAVHIGDDPVRDVAGAREAGLTSLQYEEELGWRGLPDRIRLLQRLPYR